VKRTYRYVEASGTVALTTEDGEIIEIPVVAGILKHLDVGQLTQMVRDPAVARKYTDEALRKAPWSALRRFPRPWLLARLKESKLPEGRRRALEFLLEGPGAGGRDAVTPDAFV
jgi:hypothetical protein